MKSTEDSWNSKIWQKHSHPEGSENCELPKVINLTAVDNLFLRDQFLLVRLRNPNRLQFNVLCNRKIPEEKTNDQDSSPPGHLEYLLIAKRQHPECPTVFEDLEIDYPLPSDESVEIRQVGLLARVDLDKLPQLTATTTQNYLNQLLRSLFSLPRFVVVVRDEAAQFIHTVEKELLSGLSEKK